MFKKMGIGMYCFMKSKLESIKNDERGSQTLEYIGIGAVVIAVVGAIIALTNGSGGTSIAQKFIDKIKAWIDSF